MRFAIVLVALLAGCAAETEIIREAVEVMVPVPEACDVDIPALPTYSTEALTREDTDFEKIRSMIVERYQRISMETTLRLLLEACTQPLNPEPE